MTHALERRIRWGVAMSLVFLASACAGVTTLSSPESLGKGKQQYLVAPELNGGGAKNAPIPVPELSLGYRRGVGHDFEVDAKVSSLPLGEAATTLGVEMAGKYQFYQNDRITLAAALGSGYRLIRSSGAVWEGVYANAPLLIGIRVRKSDLLVLGPRVGVQKWYSSGAHPVTIAFAGTSIGYAWSATRNLRIFPELSWMRSPTTFQDRPGGSSMATFGVGFVFGHQ